MTPQAIDAFNSASGIQMTDLKHSILTVLFVVAILWGSIVLLGKMKAWARNYDSRVIHFFNEVLRVLVVLSVILLLIHV